VQRTRNRRRETHRQHHHHLVHHSQQHQYALLHALPHLREERNSSAASCYVTRLVWSDPRPEATSETRICANFGERRFYGSSRRHESPRRAGPERPGVRTARRDANKCLWYEDIHNSAYPSIGVTSSPGPGPSGAPGGALLGVEDRGYARSCKRTSENTYSTH
jgi:hypothetical protein